MAIYELHRKFNARHQPKDEFKRNFFYDWDREEWNRFYNFMLECARIYLAEGLVEVEPRYLRQKSFLAEFKGREEVFAFIQTWEREDGFFDQWIKNEELQTRWDNEKVTALSSGSLKKQLNLYCDLKGYDIVSERVSGERAFRITKRTGE